jgi:hypothetical protein
VAVNIFLAPTILTVVVVVVVDADDLKTEGLISLVKDWMVVFVGM